MVRSSSPPLMPQMVRTRPMAGGGSLLAEHASWRMHRELADRDFESEAALQRFVSSRRDRFDTPLPSDASPADRAQELFYRSREGESWVLARRMREDALKLDPSNLDVLVDCAVYDRDFDRRLPLLEEAVALGDARLAAEEPDPDDDVRGWGVLSSRPGFRARAALTLQLVELGRLEDAIASCARLLELDPSDHQGARYLRVALLLEVGRHDEARRVLAATGEASCAIFAWAAVLLAHETGGDAEAALEVARKQNEAAEEGLLEPEMLAVPPPELHAAGSPEEAEIVGDLFWRGWHKRPAALEWLRKRARDSHLQHAPTEPVWERILELDEEGFRQGLTPFLLPVEEATVARLRRLVAEGPDDDAPHMAEWAILLLRRLGVASSAVPELVAYMRRGTCSDTWVQTEALQTLAGIGASVVRPVLDAVAEESDPDVRFDLAQVLARTGVRDEAVFGVLVEQFEADEVLGAGLFFDYGDARALPLLSARLDQADPDTTSSVSSAADLIETIEELGGSLSEGQQARFAKLIKMRAHWESPEGLRELEDAILRATRQDAVEGSASDLLEGRSGPLGLFDHDPVMGGSVAPVLSRPDRPGRNEPCWCGSGQKYKRCHLQEDDAASS